MQTIKAELLDVDPGVVRIALPFREELTQQHGYLHAAAVTAIADSACGYAAYTLMEPTQNVLSVEFKINRLSPAEGERFVATGKVLKPGRTLTVCVAEVHAEQDGKSRLIAQMQATMIALSGQN